MDEGFQYIGDSSVSRGRSKKPFFVLLLLILIGIGIFVVSQTTDVLSIMNPQPTPTATPFPTQEPLPTEEPTEAPTPSGPTSRVTSPTPTRTSAASSVDKATGLDRADITVAIQNGSGVAGAAGKMSTLLQDLGYEIGATGNADSFDYEDVTIQVKPAFSKYLPLLKSDISGDYTVGSTAANLSTGTADALIIIGK